MATSGRTLVAGAPDGVHAMILGDLATQGRDILHVARDDAHLQRTADALGFFHPETAVLHFPAWDCLPYDRTSPLSQIQAQRTDTLSRLAQAGNGSGRVILTTVSAVLQRVPPRAAVADAVFLARRGEAVDREALSDFLSRNGYGRVGTVREPGEYAVRGGILDIFPPGAQEPLRLDFFGDSLDDIRVFDPASQKTIGTRSLVDLRTVSEIVLDDQRITRFRENYRAAFPGKLLEDPLYDAISAGRKFGGMEHWLPFFYDGLETVFDYLPDAIATLDYQVEQAAEARLELISEYYQARLSMGGADSTASDTGGFAYKPVPPESLFLDRAEWDERLARRAVIAFSPFAGPDDEAASLDAGGRGSPDFAESRARPETNVFDTLSETADSIQSRGQKVLVAAYSAGSRDRLGHVLSEHGIETVATIDRWEDVTNLDKRAIALVVLPLERGFATPDFTLITEQDLLGDRLVRQTRKRRRSDAFLTEISSLSEGDLVVHIDHGIGRFDGLETIAAGGAPHDCIRVTYDGGDKLFVPVENMDVLSRYGSEDSAAQLDRLGGAGWQARKSRIKERIKDIADKLIAIAAARQLRSAEKLATSDGLYDEFSARFPFSETDDQHRAIADVMGDLTAGRPMDRLICGDVGFGKTEVALRAAFVSAFSGVQTAVVVPTTLLARQHFKTFTDRFSGLPVRIAHLSRLVAGKEADDVKTGLANGEIDIVVGTQALLAKSVSFKNLGLLIVDEEQHFGVAQKERMKQMRTDVHVLTLTATPIPRTLQMALSGVREMSLIATPPVDRLAVRTFVLPYDPVVIREAIMREVYRGGQVYYVCPRIQDLATVADRLETLVPDVTFATAHGQMPARDLESVMTSFYEGGIQILLSTNIIESGLDIPTVNTIVIHRADRFGLAQLYQLRGRVGRSKTRAYAYLTLPPEIRLSDTAQRRLEVMQTLDTLGAGFTLASHDMDIRGAGNLVGEEQSGHIREVGIELYQQMLEEAVAASRDGAGAGQGAGADKDSWTPQITIGTPVLIPDDYVTDLSIRLGLYRRIASLVDQAEIDSFAAEMVDRFGTLPQEVENLLKIIAIKRLCIDSGVEKVDAGPKGAVLSFYKDSFAHPERLVEFIGKQAGTVKLRPDHKLVYRRQWDSPDVRVKGINHLMKQLADIAA